MELMKRLKALGNVSWLIVFIVFMLYNPFYSTVSHAKGQHYLDSSRVQPFASQVYDDVSLWMKDEEGARYLLAPQPFTATYLVVNHPDSFSLNSMVSAPPSWTKEHILKVQRAITENQTIQLGSLLASGNVKYIFTPYVNKMFEPNWVRPQIEYYPRLSFGSLAGPAGEYRKFLDRQNDLKLIAEKEGYLVYENLAYKGKIAASDLNPDVNITWKQITPTQYQVKAESNGRFAFYLSESYDSEWKAYLNNIELEHHKWDGWANAWITPQEGIITVKYQGGQTYLATVWISLIAFTLILTYHGRITFTRHKR